MLRGAQRDDVSRHAEIRQEKFEAELRRRREEEDSRNETLLLDVEERERIIAMRTAELARERNLDIEDTRSEKETYMKRVEIDIQSGHEKNTNIVKETWQLSNQPVTNGESSASPAPPRTDLYASYRGGNPGEAKLDEKASTQPFSPRSSTSGRHSPTTNSTGFGVIDQGHTAVSVDPRSSLQQQGTVDEVEEIIEESKHDTDDSDDQFNF